MPRILRERYQIFFHGELNKIVKVMNAYFIGV